MESCLFTGNTCGGAGAVCLGGSAALVNCTIVANTGSTCSGVKMNTSKVRAVNCAIFGNTAPDTATGKVFDDNGTCFVNCAADLEIPGGTGCLCVEPAFRDAAGGDWRLSPASPLIDAGTAPAAYGAASETDLDGSPRVVPAAVDIGCYENPKSDVECGFVFSCPVPLVPAEVAFAGAAFGFAGTPSFAWEVANDATGETEYLSGATPVWTTTVPGVYTVRLTVAGDEGTATYERASCLALAPPDMYTSPGNAAAAYPYATPETAAPDVATAVAAAADGTTIHVLRGADGVYPQSATIVVEKGRAHRRRDGRSGRRRLHEPGVGRQRTRNLPAQPSRRPCVRTDSGERIPSCEQRPRRNPAHQAERRNGFQLRDPVRTVAAFRQPGGGRLS